MEIPEKRAVAADRRRKPTPLLSEHTFRGQRRGPRRDKDPRINYYVDRPDAIAPEWMIGFNVSPVVKNVFAEWF